MLRSGSIALSGLLMLCCAANPVAAAEGGASAYILGIRGPGSGVTPPPGLFLSNQVYIYRGEIEGTIPLEGDRLIGRGDVTAIVNIPTLLWVTPLDVAGGRLGLTLTVPFGGVDIEGSLGPLALADQTVTVADPSLGAFLGWRHDEFHWQVGATAFVPLGDYQQGDLANVAKHRTSFDFFGTLSWIDPELGLDLTNVVGVTYNLENEATNYKTGTEFHWEGSLTKKFDIGISIGPAGYYYRQLEDDSGIGAVLGGFRGEAAAIGAVVGYDFKVGRLPVSAKLRYFHEVDTTNRFEGDVGFISLSAPLWVQGQ